MFPQTYLLRWYKQHGRNLPWRKTKDPYKILVSEMMLIQTQVSRVLSFYKKWLKRFPSFTYLAKASNEDVIRTWAGLGYNRRALLLRDLAKQIVQHKIPQNSKQWQQYKGIGPYMAHVLSAFIAHEKTIPLDTNIRRVLGRVLIGLPFPQLFHDLSIKKQAQKKFFLNPKQHNETIQALFDLASLVCLKKPACLSCPLRTTCKSSTKFLSGRIQIPKQSIQKNKERVYRNKKYPDRIYRGRILTLIQKNKKGVLFQMLGKKIDVSFDPLLDEDWLKDMIKRLEKDELVKFNNLRVWL
jgi:A/G-specific adenine glycosylase